MREVVWQTDALKELLAIARADARQAMRIFDALVRSEGTGDADIRALKGQPGEYRIRVGDWRVLLRVDGDRGVVTRVVMRRDAYD